jgi:lipoprotein NlpD
VFFWFLTGGKTSEARGILHNFRAHLVAAVLGPRGWVVLLFCALLSLSGCAGSPNYAPVSDLHSPPERVPSSYVVRTGDTLFSIAFRYGLDFRGLAAANGIGPDYRINPSQRLKLSDKPIKVAITPVRYPQRAPTAAKVSSSNTQSKAATPTRGQAYSPPQKLAHVIEPTELTAWQWPTEGSIIRSFSASQYAHKGIDIAGKQEQPVKAVAKGVVVYAGSGLVGYGKLLIVKHSERYLSAYAHNNRLLVKEGETIRQGQVIARMGDTGTDRTKLHFEIRKDGKPINPVSLLPKRN